MMNAAKELQQELSESTAVLHVLESGFSTPGTSNM